MSVWIEGVNAFSALCATALWRACWQGALALLLVWGVCRRWPAIPAGVQGWLWRLAWGKLLIALLCAGAVPLALLPGQRETPVRAETVVAAPTPTVIVPSKQPLPANDKRSGLLPLNPAVTVPAPTAGMGSRRTTLPQPPPSPTPFTWLLLLWVAGAGWSLWRLWHAWQQVRWLRAKAVLLQHEEIRYVLHELCAAFHLQRVPALATGPVSTPLLLGVRRPMIILPESALAGDANRLRLMLAHELAHLRRGDLRWAWLTALVEVLFFFHPLLWLTRREAHLAQEMACDALVVETLRQPAADYGATLLAVLAQQSGRQPQWLTAGISEAGLNMQRRLFALGRRALSRRAALAIALALLLPASFAFIPWRVTARNVAAARASSLLLAPQDDALRKQLSGIPVNNAHPATLPRVLQQNIDALRIRAGVTEVEGPGIVITLDDTNKSNSTAVNPDTNFTALIIHDIDLIMLVNELREAGAEAIAINGQRVVGSTAIRCVGPVIHVNDHPVSTPYVVQAIGNSAALFSAMNLLYGELAQLRPLGIHSTVEKKDKITVPAIGSLPPLVFGKAGKSDSKHSAVIVTDKQLQHDINDLRLRVGVTSVEGPGIVITLDDTKAGKANRAMHPTVNPSALLIHDVDLMTLVNELREAGAEAIAINDQRVAGSTAIRSVGPVIHVNGRPVSTPFVIRAIGKTDVLYGAMNLPYGLIDQLRPLGINISMVKKEKITIPAIVGLPPLAVGKVVNDVSKNSAVNFTYFENGWTTEPLAQVRQGELDAVRGGHQPWRQDALWVAQVMGMPLLPPVPKGEKAQISGAGNNSQEIQVSASHWNAVFRLISSTSQRALVEVSISDNARVLFINTTSQRAQAALSSIDAQIKQLEQQRESLLRSYLPTSREVQAIDAQIKITQARKRAEVLRNNASNGHNPIAGSRGYRFTLQRPFGHWWYLTSIDADRTFTGGLDKGKTIPIPTVFSPGKAVPADLGSGTAQAHVTQRLVVKPN